VQASDAKLHCMRRCIFLTAPLLLLCLILQDPSAFAQVFGFWRGPVVQNDPPPTEFVVARWRYRNNGNIGGMGWAHNYPEGEMHLNEFIRGVTNVNVEHLSYRIVNVSSDEVFQYPFALVSEPGEMNLNEKEVYNLREYIHRGGFVLIDDFDGPWQFDNFRRQMRQAFPTQELYRLTAAHPAFSLFYEIPSLTIFATYVPGDEPIFYGLNNDDGTLAMVACFNNDLENFWDWYGSPAYPLRPATEAFRVGTNLVIYSMTH
jgi:hypothetical protein